ncbi:hypothetical protein [Vibrio agarivorans]|uniref:hypothetical protein n=1 Tax=Vibrio agarivorans TaxID=153622 RepID=UPI0025B5389A|nr:hypothetical protein [Vibrio agarivorans]MDN3660442.1 hypothetical protein [Vibrio agarivorans]
MRKFTYWQKQLLNNFSDTYHSYAFSNIGEDHADMPPQHRAQEQSAILAFDPTPDAAQHNTIGPPK